ncbi:MAG TPA: hypothetical protein VNA69_19565, partial [Thermoanaerobaculia bacterium]|nr:hypothetical protein [Thermoanaerobaculia bacterium]
MQDLPEREVTASRAPPIVRNAPLAAVAGATERRLPVGRSADLRSAVPFRRLEAGDTAGRRPALHVVSSAAFQAAVPRTSCPRFV